MELADGALADPVLEVVLSLLGDFLLVGGLLDGFPAIVVLVLDGSWLGRIASLGFRVGVVFADSAALDIQCLRVGEFDFNVLLSDAGEFAVEMVGVLGLADVEAGSEA